MYEKWRIRTCTKKFNDGHTKKVCISGCDIFQMSIVYAVHFCGLVQAINTKNALNSKTSILYWPCLFVN